MNDNYNPDYPVANGGSFLNHSYLQPQAQNNSFWYAGANVNPQQAYYPDSRRNIGSPYTTNPMMPNMSNMPTQTQTPVMPFSSYPQNTTQPAFNSLVESRRNDTQPNSVGSNPWASQPAQPTFTPPVTPQPAQMPSPWTYQSAYDPNCAALYNPNLNFTFEKGASAWDNPYAAPAPIMQPIINWNAPNMPQPSVMPPSCPAYQQVYNFPQTNLNWNDIAEKNWGKTIL